jgi:phage terminase large subunit-like protein
MWEALSPTQSAQRSPIMLLTSTAGNAESVVLRAFYDRLKREASGDDKPDPSFYGAWWASRDSGAGLDWSQIRQANPALGDGRLTKEAITSEHRILPVDSWQRERLNHFVDAVAVGAFNPGVWAECRTPGPLDGIAGPFALGVDVQPGWERATIVAAAIRPDGRVGAAVYRDLIAAEGDTVSVADIVRELLAFPDPVSRIVWDSVSGAHSEFVRTSADAWATEWIAQKPHEVVAACMDVTQMIQSGQLAVDDPLLDVQLPNVARRPVGQDGAFRFSRAHSLGPIDAFMALTLAAHAAASVEQMPRII